MTETATIGHNSKAGKDVRSLIMQIVSSEREKEGIQTDISEIYKGAKEAGFSVKALRRAVRWNMMSPTDRTAAKEIDDMVEQYLHASGVLD